ncbi:MAG: SDR family NAD(P)-dependent oxidoreductase, partial [Marinovum sp.]|nr:SDR family NAD(P)-dependent oxidoreductase [Marinovum sp.]
MFTSLKGKSVIVTGGSKGIGRGIAQVFARQGVKLTIAARNEEDLKTAVGEIGGDTRYEVCDVSDWASVQAMVDSAAKAQGGLDVMCANAGAFQQTKMIDMDPVEW